MLQVQKWGNSLGIRIPKALAQKAGLEEGAEVDMDVENGCLVIKPKGPVLEELLQQITSENLHGEIATGAATGEESW